jgi:nucleotide-binding universal stress UspA family protein
MAIRVLLPFDGSPSSVEAARYVAREFRNREASVLLLNVQQVYLDAELVTMGRVLLAALRADGEAALREGIEILERAGIEHEAKVGFGPVPQVIAHVAKEAGSGLIVMGTRARHPLIEIIARAVPARVLRASGVPVVLVRRDATGRTKTSSELESRSIAA